MTTFASLWTDLIESCGYPGQIARVVMALADAPISLDELLEAGLRAGA